MSGPINYCQGDLLQGSFSLRVNDSCVLGKQNPWPIPAGAIVTMRFSGTSTAVVISSAVAVVAEFGGGTEVVVTNSIDGDCSFTLIPTKGALMALSPTVNKILQAQTFDIVVNDSLGVQLQTFEVLGSIVSGTGIVVFSRAVA